MTPDATATLGTDLLRCDAAELLQRATECGLEPAPNLERSELLAELLRHHLEQGRRVELAGVLELLPEGFGFLRFPNHDFDAGAADVYISPSQVRALNLKSGHTLCGPIRAPKGNERFFALLHTDTIGGRAVEELRRQIAFAARMPVVPTRPLVLPADRPEWRLLGQLAPWQFGQRVLLVTPPDWPRARFLARLAAAIAAGQPATTTQLCLLDQGPDAIAAARALAGPSVAVIATTFDRAADRHLATLELALLQACRQVETGACVVLLVDSLTALARVAQAALTPAGRWLCPGLEVQALGPGKRLFAAARACAEGGSLTVIATLGHEPGSAFDAALWTEFGSRGNSEVVIDAKLAAAGIELPFDLARTRTRPEDETRSAAERRLANELRQRLAAAEPAARAGLL
jgi:transcription termination factor Rho